MGIVGTVLSVFLLLFVGYGAKKVRLLRAEDTVVLSTVVLYITLPAFVFEAIYSYREPLPLSIVKVPIIGLAAILGVIGISYLVGRALKLDRTTTGGLMIAAGFGNTGFLGYPVVQAAFEDGSALVTAALYDELAMAAPLYTIGAVIAAGFAGERVDRAQLRKVLTIPALWAIPAALLMRPFIIPEFALDAIRYLALGTIPLAMISMGLSLSASSLRGMAIPVLAACAMKLVVLPLLTHYSLTAGGVTGAMHQATVLESGMPTAVMAGVVASRFGKSGLYVAGVIFVSTLLSIVSIPVTLALLGVR